MIRDIHHREEVYSEIFKDGRILGHLEKWNELTGQWIVVSESVLVNFKENVHDLIESNPSFDEERIKLRTLCYIKLMKKINEIL